MTDQQRPSRPSIKPVALLVSLGLATGALVGGISYQQSRQLIQQAQERGRDSLALGLAVGLADLLTIRDYAGMESRLEQAMADESLASALVVDTTGKVVVHLQRQRPAERPRLMFEPAQLTPPQPDQAQSIAGRGISTRWTPIEAGEAVGWLRLRTWSTSTDAVLDLLARQYLLLGVLAAGLLGTSLGMGYHQLRRQHRRQQLQLQQEKAVLMHTAHTDPLTGVANRRGIEQRLERILAAPESGRGAGVAVCMIDLDNFKPVNDLYGHSAGDQLLVAVTRRLQDYLRKGDHVGRMGGDEFIVVIQGCSDRQQVETLAHRITAGLSQPFQLHDLEVCIGASVGVALGIDDPTGSMEQLLERADRAMYQAKQAGKGAVVLAPQPQGPKPGGGISPPPAPSRW